MTPKRQQPPAPRLKLAQQAADTNPPQPSESSGTFAPPEDTSEAWLEDEPQRLSPRLRRALVSTVLVFMLSCGLVWGVRSALHHAVHPIALPPSGLHPVAPTGAALTSMQRAQLERRLRALSPQGSEKPQPDPLPPAVRSAKPPSPPPVPQPPTDLERYAAYYGAPNTYARAVRGPSGAAKARAKGLASVKGTLLRARLRDDVPSSPLGSPVVAVLTHPAEVAGVRLEPGTEIEGTTVAVQGLPAGRLALHMVAARLADGRRYRLDGTAQDGRGRLGLPARPHSPNLNQVRQRTWAQLVEAAGAEAAQHLPYGLRGGLQPLIEAGTPRPPNDVAELWLLGRAQKLTICLHAFNHTAERQRDRRDGSQRSR